MSVLQAKLQQIEDERREAEITSARGGKLEQGWGTQIRSYVFYDNRVKDHRTGYEESDYEAVLRGEIAPFIDAELQRHPISERVRPRSSSGDRSGRASEHGVDVWPAW